MCISTSWWVDKKLKIIYSYNGILLTNDNKLKQIPDICNHTYKTQKHIRDLIWVIPEWLNDFPYFNLSLNFAIRNPWSKQQSAPGLVFVLTVYFSIFDCKEYNQYDFYIYHPVMSMFKVISWVVGKGCWPWPVSSLDRTVSLCPA